MGKSGTEAKQFLRNKGKGGSGAREGTTGDVRWVWKNVGCALRRGRERGQLTLEGVLPKKGTQKTTKNHKTNREKESVGRNLRGRGKKTRRTRGIGGDTGEYGGGATQLRIRKERPGTKDRVTYAREKRGPRPRNEKTP